MSFQTRAKFLNEANRTVTKSYVKELLRGALGNYPLDYMHSDIPATLFKTYHLRASVFDKYLQSGSTQSSERKDACLAKYKACEARCRVTNERFRNREFAGTVYHHLLMLTRQQLNEILGRLPSDFIDKCTFGPGASTRLSRPFVDAAFKLEGKPHITSLLNRCLPADLLSKVWPNGFEIMECAKYTTVPKSSVIDRPIEIQPCINMFFQKALGNIIRSRMKGRYCGRGYATLDLNDQTFNQNLARLGSQSGDIATLDLSSASDLISTELVNYLIEDVNWLGALYVSRVGLVELEDGNILPLEKFSAMGNGYTWELQSAIFYSMVRAVNVFLGCDDYIVSTYGDDIICHKDVVPLLVDFLTFCGFSVNEKKSYWSGFFRESCGKHYYKGYDVTPCYLRGPLTTNREVISFRNRLYEWCSRDGYKDLRMLPVLNELEDVLSCTPLRVPFGYGDIGLITCRNDIDLASVRRVTCGQIGRAHV